MSQFTTSSVEFERESSVSQNGTWKKASGLSAIVIVVAWYFWSGSFSNPSNPHLSMAGGVPEVSVSSAEDAVSKQSVATDEEFRKLIVGKWETDRNGRRELTVDADGTAKMDVRVNNTLARMLLGEHLVLFLEWKIEQGELTLITTGGEPTSKVEMMTSMYGKERSQKIITLNETTLHHPDDDPGGEDHIWKRIAN